MADAAVLLGLALLAGAVSTVSPAPAAFAFAATLAVVRPRLGRTFVVVLLVTFVIGAARAGRAVARFDRARSEVRDALGGPARCVASVVVASSPVLYRSAPAALARQPADGTRAAELVPSWDANVTQIECDGRPAMSGFRARVYGGPDDLARGDSVDVIANLAPVQIFRNADLADPRPGGARRAVLASGGAEDVRVTRRVTSFVALIDRFRAHARRRIEATFAPAAAPMGRALVLGESDLDEPDAEAFRASGLAHLLAVSGTHLVLVVAGAVRALAALLRRVELVSARWDAGRIAAAFGAGFAWVYADFAGGSGSAIRAAAMLSFALGAEAVGRASNGPRALGLSLVGLAIADPLVAFDFSFLLSVAATGGLMVLQRPMASWLERPLGSRRSAESPSLSARVWRPVASALATTLAATIGCAPLIAFMAPTLPIGGVLANLLAVPVGEVAALPLCLGHTLLAFAPVLERGAAVVASGSLLVVRSIARVTGAAHWLALPVPAPTAWQFAIVWSLGSAWLLRASRRLWLVAAGCVVLPLSEVVARRVGAPRDHLALTMLDVGQGDASIVDLPDGRAMLFDAGGMVGSPIDTGRAVVAPVLRSRRRSALAIVVLSHPHPDHFGGLASALSGIDVGEVWDTGQGEAEGAGPVYASLLADLRARGVPIVRPAALCDRPRSFGPATVEVLAPCPEPIPFVNANDNSFVVRVTFGRRAVLLVGDAERAEEQSLLRNRPHALRADFLKVGHHGSGTSSWPEFVQAVGAEEFGISCGVRNRFGHPHPATMRTLSASGRVHRTDREGSVRWETDGTSIAVATAAHGERASPLTPEFSRVQGRGGAL